MRYGTYCSLCTAYILLITLVRPLFPQCPSSCGTCPDDPLKLDCNGALNGNAVMDACGVCDGDGSSCTVHVDCSVGALYTMLSACCTVGAGDGHRRAMQGAVGCDAFPATCSDRCALLFVPIYQNCVDTPLLQSLPEEIIPTWDAFSSVCAPQRVQSKCDNFDELSQHLEYVSVVCCEEAHEACSAIGTYQLPSTSCTNAGCAAVVRQTQDTCGGFLAGPLGSSAVNAALGVAAALCLATLHSSQVDATVAVATSVYSMQQTQQVVGSLVCAGGDITDGEGRYTNNLRQLVLLRAPPGYRVRFEMREIDLQPNDVLVAYDGRTDNGVPLARYIGNDLRTAEVAQTSGAELLLVLTTDGAGAAEGFRAHFGCSCADDENWFSYNGFSCADYAAPPQHSYCGSDGASVHCPVSCGGLCSPLCGVDSDCGHGGRCMQGGCVCADGWGGEHCDTPL
eukprot:SAG11_NODE_2352_length_3479_cov_3.213314_1_plen_452_part_00